MRGPAQPIAFVTSTDVERIVRRDFPEEQFFAVTKVLQEYGSEKWHREPDRVRTAALKLSGGTTEGLRRAIDAAKRDYRDVLAWAEYPKCTKTGFWSHKLAFKEREQLYAEDWQQYQAWLRK